MNKNAIISAMWALLWMTGCAPPEDSTEVPVDMPKAPSYVPAHTLGDLAGQWQLDHAYESAEWTELTGQLSDFVTSEGVNEPIYAPSLLLITGDSSHALDYPCEWVDRGHLRFEADTLIITGSDGSWSRALVSCHRDSLTLTYPGYTELYRRDTTTLDPGVMTLLQRDSLNPACLLGSWQLNTHYDSGYDGNGTVELHWPVRLRNSLRFDNIEAVQKHLSGKILMAPVNGSRRPFRLSFRSREGSWPLMYSDSHFSLEPLDWKSEDEYFSIISYLKD